jgi:hypothetical protein
VGTQAAAPCRAARQLAVHRRSPQADPLAVDMDPHHHHSSRVDDRPTCSQWGVNDRKQTGCPQLTAGQQRQIRKTRCDLSMVGIASLGTERAQSETKGRRRAYADGLRDFYRS